MRTDEVGDFFVIVGRHGGTRRRGVGAGERRRDAGISLGGLLLPGSVGMLLCVLPNAFYCAYVSDSSPSARGN